MKTGGNLYREGLLTADALDAAITAYLADPSKQVAVEIGKGTIDVSAAVLANTYSVEVLARKGATAPQRRHASRTATLLPPIG